MKLLRTEFVANYDKCGDNKFIQVKLNDVAAVYRREHLDGTLKSFEVFKLKIVEAGASLPGGGKVEETYVSYPGAHAFGKSAWEFKNETAAINKFNELTDAANAPVVKVEPKKYVPTGGKRGRKASVKASVVFPKGQFTMKSLLKVNTSYKQPNLYIELQKLVKGNKVKVVGHQKSDSGRGKPQVVYGVV